MFSDDQLMRYSRQIMMPEVDIAGQEKISKTTVLVVGAGGLGCPTSMYLAAAGIGHLIMADHDQVEESNLQRQIGHDEKSINQSKVLSLQQTIKRLRSDITTTVLEMKLDEDSMVAAVQQADIVVDCSDNFKTRFSLNKTCYSLKKPLVSGAAIRWEAQVSVYDARNKHSPCYQCLYGEVSDEQELTCSESGVIAPLVGIVGSLQAQETLKIALGMNDKTLVGRLVLFDAQICQWREMKFQKDPQCPICGDE